MCSRYSVLALLLIAATALAAPPMATFGESAPRHVDVPPGLLRVCADPNNLPFSNDREQGFENAIARIVGAELHRSVRYTWWPQRRGFVRNTLNAGKCDVVLGVPAGYALTRNTRPYYRSTYVFVTRADRHAVTSFDDPLLRTLRIGVPVAGDDYDNPPPVVALAVRGLYGNVHGFSLYGDYSQTAPPARLVDAVANDDVDVAIAWGPMAGYCEQAGACTARADAGPLRCRCRCPFQCRSPSRWGYGGTTRRCAHRSIAP